MAIAVENLTGQVVTPPEMADFALKIGARAAEGTDMAALAKAACERWGLEMRTSNDINAVLSAVLGGAIVICNVAGDRAGHKGVFSNGGHYIACVGAGNGVAIIADPGIYPGKFETAWRSGKVSAWGDLVVTDAVTLDEDCAGRWPKYYILEKGRTMNE